MSEKLARLAEGSNKHPSPQQLATFTRGGGSQAFRAAIAKHTAKCTVCQAEVEMKNQTLVEAVASESDTLMVGHGRNSQGEAITEHAPSPKSSYGQYQIVRELGRGAMGIVYLVEHRLTGRHEALKVLNPQWVERNDMRVRFLREIQLAAKLDHPNICRTLTAFEEDSGLGLVMEYLPGTDLGKIVASQGPLPVDKACEFALQVCTGLQYAHQVGLVHRDIKPSNLQVIDGEGGTSLKILDFGLSKGASEFQEDGNLTQDGRLIGTPEYMAPEQAASPSKADIRADLYSLGCTLYFLLAGRPPFVSETLLGVIHSHLVEIATPLTELNPHVPQPLWEVIERLLAKSPDLRPNTPAEVAELIRSSLHEPQLLAADAVTANHLAFQAAARPTKKQADSFATGHRPLSRRKRMKSWSMTSFVLTLLPPIALVGYLLAFRGDLTKNLYDQYMNTDGSIALADVPIDFEILINDRPAKFERRSAASLAQLPAEPGTYKLTLKFQGVIVLEEQVAVQARRETRLSLDPKVVDFSRKKSSELNAGKTNQSGSKSDADPQPTPGESPNGNKPGAFADVNDRAEFPLETIPSPEQHDRAQATFAQARLAFRNRDEKTAADILKSIESVPLDERSRDQWQQYVRFAENLREYKARLANAISMRRAGESFRVGAAQTEVAFVEGNVETLILRFNGKNQSFPLASLPASLEQALVELEPATADSNHELIVATGLSTHPSLANDTREQLDGRVRILVGQGQASVAYQQLIEEMGSQVAAQTPANDRTGSSKGEPQLVPSTNPPVASDFRLQRRLEGSVQPIGKLFVLPQDIPILKQQSLLSSERSAFGSTLSHLWDLRTGTKTQADELFGPLWQIQSSKNGSVFAAYGMSQGKPRIQVFVANSPKPIRVWDDFKSPHAALSLSPDGRTLAGCDSNETFVKWNVHSGLEVSRIVARLPYNESEVTAIDIRHAMDMVAVGDEPGGVHVWRTSNGGEVGRLAPVIPADPIKLIRFVRGTPSMILLRHSGQVQLLNTDTFTIERSSDSPGPVIALATSSSSRYLITAHDKNVIRIWDTTTFQALSSFVDDHPEPVSAVAVDVTGNLVIVGYEDAAIKIWKKNG